MRAPLEKKEKYYIFDNYPKVALLYKCILEFREIYQSKNLSYLYLFINNYSNCEIQEISSFAKGLWRDLEAVEHSVSSNLSNGFVEGTNNKLKMIKRTMYGRCHRKLLEAKMMLDLIRYG